MLAASDCGVAAEAAVGAMAAPIATMPTAVVSRAADLRMRVVITGMWSSTSIVWAPAPALWRTRLVRWAGVGTGAVTWGERPTGVAAVDRTIAAAGD
ncbi:hypothetical protein GCM10009665_25630 [Kitasatospora nipponensis]|uniref:Uncharacterized protein n=1 Tax=Kitasatospora nipponensis TaxID=258049 RepID=A0ABN1W3W5_9ACTN